ncbi:uncharacterized protein ACIQIH_000015 isoform 2-T2 [Cyanocitta cristata]
MLAQGGCARLSPARPAFLLLLLRLLQLLLLLGAAVMAQDICSSPGHGDLQAPSLFLNTSAVQEGEQVLFRCQIFPKSPATQIIFCKDGVQVHSLKAQQGKGSYYMLFTVMSGSAGTFTCGYQHKDNSNRVRNSALSAPTNLSVTGSGSSSQAGTSTAGITPTDLQTNCRDITIGLVVISLLLLAATTYSFVRKGACRERCQRQQQVPSHEAEVTEDNEIQSGPFPIPHAIPAVHVPVAFAKPLPMAQGQISPHAVALLLPCTHGPAPACRRRVTTDPPSLLCIHRGKGSFLCCQEWGEIRGTQGRGFSPDPGDLLFKGRVGLLPPRTGSKGSLCAFCPHQTPPSPTLDTRGLAGRS